LRTPFQTPQALGNFSEAEASLKDSLEIRECLERNDDMKALIGNSLV